MKIGPVDYLPSYFDLIACLLLPARPLAPLCLSPHTTLSSTSLENSHAGPLCFTWSQKGKECFFFSERRTILKGCMCGAARNFPPCPKPTVQQISKLPVREERASRRSGIRRSGLSQGARLTPPHRSPLRGAQPCLGCLFGSLPTRRGRWSF